MNELANGWLSVIYLKERERERRIEERGRRREVPTSHLKHDPNNEVNQNTVDDLLQTPNLGIDFLFRERD